MNLKLMVTLFCLIFHQSDCARLVTLKNGANQDPVYLQRSNGDIITGPNGNAWKSRWTLIGSKNREYPGAFQVKLWADSGDYVIGTSTNEVRADNTESSANEWLVEVEDGVTCTIRLKSTYNNGYLMRDLGGQNVQTAPVPSIATGWMMATNGTERTAPTCEACMAASDGCQNLAESDWCQCYNCFYSCL